VPVAQAEKTCRQCLHDKRWPDKFPRLGKSDICRDCKFGDPTAEVVKRRERKSKSMNLKDHESMIKGMGLDDSFWYS
jgi:hypothetical protein